MQYKTNSGKAHGILSKKSFTEKMILPPFEAELLIEMSE